MEQINVDLDHENGIASNPSLVRTISNCLKTYFVKWKGQSTSAQSPIKLADCIISFIGTFVGISILGVIHYRLLNRQVQD